MGAFQPLERWSVRNVVEWMATLNLYQYAHVFQRSNVDGQSLLTLNQEKLQVRRVAPSQKSVLAVTIHQCSV